MSSDFYLVPLVGNCVCTEQEKESVWQTVLKLVELVHSTRREGLLYLEDMADTEDDIFLRSCLRYIVEANPTPRRLHEYVSIWFATADVCAARRLEMAVIADGLEQVIMQRTPNATMRRLGAWLGEGFAGKVEVQLAADERERQETLQRKREERITSLVPEFDRIADMIESQLREFLSAVDERELALALLGASGVVIRSLRGVAAPEQWERLEEQMMQLTYPREGDVRFAQREMIDYLQTAAGARF